jgi:ABC-type lipoprotein export system ATPase subunit
MLTITGLRKTFRGPSGMVSALADAELSVAAGEFVSVQGPSGCGKTTLLLAAGGLLPPDSGRVQVDGQDVYALSGEARARLRAEKIGFVFQQFHLVPYLSVLDNVLVPSLALPFSCPLPATEGGSGEERSAVRERALELTRQFGLTERLRHVPAQLSTGERQRTALARAMLNGPKLILADEPTGNLDGENARAVLSSLREFARSGGAVLLVTHDPAAAEYAGRRLRFKEGRLREGG